MRLFRIFRNGLLINERHAGFDETAIETQHDLSVELGGFVKVDTIILPDPPKRERRYEEEE